MVWAYFDETVVHEQVDGKLIPTHLLILVAPVRWRSGNRLKGNGDRRYPMKASHASTAVSFTIFGKNLSGTRRKVKTCKGDAFQWVQAPPGNRSSRKQSEQDFPRHEAFRDRLADIIIEYVDEAIAFTSAVSIREGSSAKQVEKSVYKKALRDGAFKALNALSREVLRPSGGAYVILARHPDVPPWLLLQLFADMNWDNSLKGCGVFEPPDVIQLQAADYLGNAFNRMWNELPSKSAERLQEGFRKRGKPIRLQLGTSAQTPSDFLEGVRPV